MTESVYLVSVRQWQEIACKAGVSQTLQLVSELSDSPLLLVFFFSLSLLQLKSQTVPQKRKSVQISSAALRRSDERGGHEKRSSKAIFIPLQFEVLKLKLHMDAIEEINDNTRHLRLRHVRADQAAII